MYGRTFYKGFDSTFLFDIIIKENYDTLEGKRKKREEMPLATITPTISKQLI